MEKMPYRDGEQLDVHAALAGSWHGHFVGLAAGAAGADGNVGDAAGAAALGRTFTPRDALDRRGVALHLATPTTVEGFERFIAWTHRERTGRHLSASRSCRTGWTRRSGSSRHGSWSRASRRPRGFAIGSAFWGSGAFLDGAKMVVDFAFDVVGAHRLEARAAVANGRGNGALRKIGAVQEGVPQVLPAQRRHGSDALDHPGRRLASHQVGLGNPGPLRLRIRLRRLRCEPWEGGAVAPCLLWHVILSHAGSRA